MIMGSIGAGIAFRKWKRALLIAFEEALKADSVVGRHK